MAVAVTLTNVGNQKSSHNKHQMDWQPKSHRYLLLQVWCALLTVAMVVMAALFASIKPKPAENEALTLKPEVSPTANTIAAPFRATGSPLSHIEMTTDGRQSWVDAGGSQSCHSCSLTWQDNSIHCKKDSLYFLYALVAFSPPKTDSTSVVLLKHARHSQHEQKIIDGIYPNMAGGSVWVSRAVKLETGDRVRINITGDFFPDISYWGAYELH